MRYVESLENGMKVRCGAVGWRIDRVTASRRLVRRPMTPHRRKKARGTSCWPRPSGSCARPKVEVQQHSVHMDPTLSSRRLSKMTHGPSLGFQRFVAVTFFFPLDTLSLANQTPGKNELGPVRQLSSPTSAANSQTKRRILHCLPPPSEVSAFP